MFLVSFLFFLLGPPGDSVKWSWLTFTCFSFAGGNDAGLADILNQCVFQIFAPNKVTAGLMQAFPAIKAIEWLSGGDLNKYARSCEETLADSQKTIEDEGFSKQLDSLLSKTKKKLGDKGTIYYTG